MYRIILKDSERDEDGPHEIFPEMYGEVNRVDLNAMRNLANKLSDNFDGTYVVILAS